MMDPSSSSSSYLSPAPLKASRFSSIKVFGKFGNKNKEKPPPPVPPKDQSYYLNSNRSFVSISSQYARSPAPGSIHPSHSTMSLASSAVTADSDAMLSPPSSARPRSKKSGFFKLKRVSGDDESVKPTEDENISMPWNFQHNVHVDEGFHGMPPSWTVSLAEAGFTQEEIAAIYSRKQSRTLTPSSVSPAIIANPVPRTTSLPRQYSDASLRSASSSVSPPPPPLPLNPLIARSKVQQRSRNNSASSSSLALSISLDTASDAKMRHSVLAEQGRNETEIQPHHRSNSSSSGQAQVQGSSSLTTTPPMNLKSLSTPPRRAYYVANANITQSPPPAYDASNGHPKHGVRPREKIDRMSDENASSVDEVGVAQADSRLDAETGNDSDTESNKQDDVPPVIPLTPLTLPEIGSGLGFNFFDLGFTDPSPNTNRSAQNPLLTVSPVAIDDTAAKRTTVTPSSLSLSPVFSPDSDLRPYTLLTAPILTPGPPASPTSPFPRSPSPPRTPLPSPSNSAAKFEESELPLTGSTISAPGTSSSLLSTGLFSEIQGLLAPGGMTEQSNALPRRKKKSKKESGFHGKTGEKNLTPIERLRGYTGSDDEDEDEDWDDEEQDQEVMTLDGWNSPAISESHSLTLPPTSPNSPSSRDKRSGSRVSAYQIEERDSLAPSARNFRNSSRSSTSTVSTLSAITVTQATHVTATATVFQRALATKVAIGSPSTGTGSLSLPASSQNQQQNPQVPLQSRSPVPSAVPSPMPSLQQSQTPSTVPPSPQSSTFGSEEEASAPSSRMSGASTNTSTSSSISPTTDANTTEEDEDESGMVYYLDSPLPTQTAFDQTRIPKPKQRKGPDPLSLRKSTTDTFGGTHGDDEDPYEAGYDEEDEDVIFEEEEQKTLSPHSAASIATLDPPSSAPVRPTILINSGLDIVPTGPFSAPVPYSSASSSFGMSPITPGLRYHGWLAEVVKPLEEYIDEPIDPREYYLDLTEVAEGENGSVYSARISEAANLARLTKLPPLIKARDVEEQANGETMVVAIKTVPILPSGSTKLDELKKELAMLRGIMHGNILGMHALYVDLAEDYSLWIRMELMQRSLADVVIQCEEGLVLQERVIARFAHDTLDALLFLRSHNIAHRDVRSDNLLLNSEGVLKLTDFSSAVKVSPSSPIVTDVVGILYWQAPEVRSGPYNALKVDVWSVGATVWELAQATPPFSDSADPPAERWPKLRKPELFSPAFHEFLRMCSNPASSRPDAQELLKNSFVNNVCGRPVIQQLLHQCVAIEKVVSQRQELNGEDESTLM